MRLFIIAALLATATPALAAREPSQQEAGKPVSTNGPVKAGDVVATPAQDLNLSKQDIPPLLLAAQDAPYGLAGLRSCARIASAVGELDAVLGDDIDLAPQAQQRTSAGRLAKSAVGSFIPFRGVIRELSGANAQERRLAQAVQAGLVRRAFLKGVGQQRGCRYPARSATPEVIAQREVLDAAADASLSQKRD